MRLAIDHTLQFTYSSPVLIDPMTVRLTPATTAFQTCESHEFDCDPEPAAVSPVVDLWGHPARVVRIDGRTSSLTLRARSVVETLCQNPFDYTLTDHSTLQLPVSYSPAVMGALGGALRIRGDECPQMSKLIAEVKRGATDRTLDFLFQLCVRLNRDIASEPRAEGGPRPVCKTLAAGKGACRDTAMVFIEACRRVGLAARFVSGYKFDPAPEGGEAELHAWAEVYLPGGGWRGYDPSEGLAVADRHVALTASHDPTFAAATTGTFRGINARSTLKTEVRIQALDRETIESVG